MILCVTPNPAVDRTLVVPCFSMGAIYRPEKVIVAPGGKGINVARAVHVLGGEAVCCGFLGGHAGRLIIDLMHQEELPGGWTLIEGETRTCIIIADPDLRQTTVINEQGPTVTDDDWARLKSDLLYNSTELDYISFSGSLPPGSTHNKYSDALDTLIQMGKQVWADTSGVSLKAAVALRDVNIKVNNEEAGELLSESLINVQDVARAAFLLLERGPRTVILTMGAEGAVLAHQTGTWYAKPPTITVQSTVASGDSFLAGILVALSVGKVLPDALCYGVAAGAANALSVGGAQFSMDDFHRILHDTEVYPFRED